FQRDRVRALQLMQQALAQTGSETDKPALARFHLAFANLLANGAGGHEPWRLQYLTDLTKLPDYEEGYYWRGGGNAQGALVAAAGTPVFYRVPRTYEAAPNDGDGGRWNPAQAAEYDPARLNEIEMSFARFLREQFDVQTLAAFGRWPGGDDAGEGDKKEG